MSFDEERLFIFDAGTGIKELAAALMAKRSRVTARIFISHPHWDHIDALPYFAPVYVPGNAFEILGATHGDVPMRQMISTQMDGVYFPVTMREFAARVYFRDLRQGDDRDRRRRGAVDAPLPSRGLPRLPRAPQRPLDLLHHRQRSSRRRAPR